MHRVFVAIGAWNKETFIPKGVPRRSISAVLVVVTLDHHRIIAVGQLVHNPFHLLAAQVGEDAIGHSLQAVIAPRMPVVKMALIRTILSDPVSKVPDNHSFVDAKRYGFLNIE